jgi:hypothetical protein
VALVLYALLFLPALLAIAYVVHRRPRIVEEAVVAAGENPFEAVDALLARLESTTLEERDVDELEQLADELERAALALERVA